MKRYILIAMLCMPFLALFSQEDVFQEARKKMTEQDYAALIDLNNFGMGHGDITGPEIAVLLHTYDIMPHPDFFISSFQREHSCRYHNLWEAWSRMFDNVEHELYGQLEEGRKSIAKKACDFLRNQYEKVLEEGVARGVECAIDKKLQDMNRSDSHNDTVELVYLLDLKSSCIPNLDYYLGLVCWELRDFENAEMYFTKVLESDLYPVQRSLCPDCVPYVYKRNREWALGYLLTYYYAIDNKEVFNQLLNLAVQKKLSISTCSELSDLLYAGDIPQAKELLEIEAQDNNARACLALGKIYEKEQNRARALTYFCKAIKTGLAPALLDEVPQWVSLVIKK